MKKMRRKSEKIIRFCVVCGDKAKGMNFNALTCQSCKAFFRRNALSNKELKCSFENCCTIDKITRKFCSSCRLKKCFDNGMKKEYILTDEEKRLVREKILQNRYRREQQSKLMNNYNNNDNIIAGTSNSSELNSNNIINNKHDSYINNRKIDATVTSSILKPYPCRSFDSNKKLFENQSHTSDIKQYSTNIDNNDYINDIYMSPCSSTSIFSESLSSFNISNQSESINDNIHLDSSFDSSDLDNLDINQSQQQQQQKRQKTETIIKIACQDYDNNEIIFNVNDNENNNNNINGKNENIFNDFNHLKIKNDDEYCDDYLRYYLLQSIDLEEKLPTEFIHDIHSKFDIKNFLSCDYKLMYSEDEKLFLKELCSACIYLHNPYKRMMIIRNQHYLNDSPHECTLVDSFLYRMIRFSKRLSLFTSLQIDDQIQLLTFGMIEILSLFSTLCYDPEFQGWSFIDDEHKITIKVNIDCITPCCIKYDYKTSVKNFYNTFKYEWKTDYIIFYLLTTIILFTERPGIKESDKIRERKTIYIELLKNYLNLKYMDNTDDAKWAFDRMFLTVQAMQLIQTDLLLHLVASTAGKKFSPLLGQLMDKHLNQQQWQEDDKKLDCNINRLSNRSRITSKISEQQQQQSYLNSKQMETNFCFS